LHIGHVRKFDYLSTEVLIQRTD